MILRSSAMTSVLSASACALLLGMSLTLSAENTPIQETQATSNASATPESMAFMVQNQNESIENRVQALHFISQYPNQNSLVAVARALKDENAQIREAAITGATPYPLEHRYRMVSPLLTDENQAVRIAAVLHLLKDYEQLQMSQQAGLRSQADALVNVLVTDKSYSQQLLLADIYRWTYRYKAAQDTYQSLLSSDQKTTELFLNLSHNFYAQGENQKALNIIEEGIKFDNKEAPLHYSKALALVRLQQKDAAAVSMKTATELAPQNAYYWYLNGVLQEPLDIDLSIKSFEQAYLISGSPENLYAMCDIYIRNNHKNTENCINSLAEIAPAEVINDLRSKQLK